MDPLTQIIELLRPRALSWKYVESKGDWALGFPENAGIVFGLLLDGVCDLILPGVEARTMQAGDFLLMASPRSWLLRSGAEVDAIDFESIYSPPERFVSHVGSGAGNLVTRFVGGHFGFGANHAELLLSVIPAVVHIHSSNQAASRLRQLIDLIGDEMMADRPGRTALLGRLFEVMLIEALRHGSDALPEGCCGLLSGLADPRIARTLRAMHADPGRRWSVAVLAAEAGMSRSAFSDFFRRRVGVAPIEYLIAWRMALAKDALRYHRTPIGEVARICGYGSSSAFSTAFSKLVGCPPGRYAEKARPITDASDSIRP